MEQMAYLIALALPILVCYRIQKILLGRQVAPSSDLYRKLSLNISLFLVFFGLWCLNFVVVTAVAAYAATVIAVVVHFVIFCIFHKSKKT